MPKIETLPAVQTFEVPPDPLAKPAPEEKSFDVVAWAESLPAVVVLSKDRPAYLTDAGQVVQGQCKLAGANPAEPCWGRVTSLDHPMARHADGATKDQSLSVHTCRAHFWQAQGLAPYTPLPKAFRK